MLDHEPDLEPAGASQESRYVQWAHQGGKKKWCAMAAAAKSWIKRITGTGAEMTLTQNSQPSLSGRDRIMKDSTRRTEFWAGVRDSLPLIIGAIPFGIIFGTLSGGAGLSAAGAMGMSVFVFAGSAQFIAMGLVGAGTAWPMIVLATFVVNFRHLLYTATLLPYLQRLPSRWQVTLAFGLTDETFAVAVGRWRQEDASPYKHWYQFGSMIFMYVNWNLCTLLGLQAGRMLQGVGGWGLDFAMVAAFIGMLIPYLKDKPSYCVVLVSGMSALAFNGLPHKLGLIIALVLGVAAGVLSESLIERRLRCTAMTAGDE